VASGFSS